MLWVSRRDSRDQEIIKRRTVSWEACRCSGWRYCVCFRICEGEIVSFGQQIQQTCRYGNPGSGMPVRLENALLVWTENRMFVSLEQLLCPFANSTLCTATNWFAPCFCSFLGNVVAAGCSSLTVVCEVLGRYNVFIWQSLWPVILVHHCMYVYIYDLLSRLVRKKCCYCHISCLLKILRFNICPFWFPPLFKGHDSATARISFWIWNIFHSDYRYTFLWLYPLTKHHLCGCLGMPKFGVPIVKTLFCAVNRGSWLVFRHWRRLMVSPRTSHGTSSKRPCWSKLNREWTIGPFMRACCCDSCPTPPSAWRWLFLSKFL